MTCLIFFISSGFLPIVTLLTRINHKTSTLIDNIYIKWKRYDELLSGIILISVDISDHFPLSVRLIIIKKVLYRPVDDMKLINIQNFLNAIDWNIMKNTKQIDHMTI